MVNAPFAGCQKVVLLKHEVPGVITAGSSHITILLFVTELKVVMVSSLPQEFDVPQHAQPVVERVANFDYLTPQDRQELQDSIPILSVDSAASILATRVQNAPQFCRFLVFERMNLVRLYKLQHQILSYGPETSANSEQPAAGHNPHPLRTDEIGVQGGRFDDALSKLLKEYCKCV